MIKRRLLPFFLQLPIARKIALVTALCSLLAAISLITASYQGTRQLIQHSSELFGLSLVEQLARDASNPLVKNDKLSLQALLHKLIQSPLVVRVAIYNVENQPVAEAGQQNIDGRALSASITFQDSIAGYAVLTLNTSTLQHQAFKLAWQLVFLALLLAMLAYFISLLPARYFSTALEDLRVLASTPPARRKANTQIGYAGKDELRALADTLIAGGSPTDSHHQSPGSNNGALLFIQIHNLMIDSEQAQAVESLTASLQSMQQQLAMICKLYDGELNIERQQGFSLRFSDKDNENSYPFRAICAGQLMMEWQINQQSSLRFSAGLVLNQSNREALAQDWQRAFIHQQTINKAVRLAEQGDGLCVSTEVYQHSSVHSRVLAEELQPQIFRIDGLTTRYSELLDHQLKALQAQKSPRSVPLAQS